MSLCFKYFNELNTRYFGVGELAVFLLCYCCVKKLYHQPPTEDYLPWDLVQAWETSTLQTVASWCI